MPGDTDVRAQESAEEDALIVEYRDVLAELTLLTTVSVLLFGFLLANARSFEDSRLEEWVFAAAVVLVASATLVFIVPVAYHHYQFPYRNFAKFQARSHRWVLMGLPLLAAGFYLSLTLAIWALFDVFAPAVAALPIVAAAIGFAVRKGEL